jgi:hypothetical protein
MKRNTTSSFPSSETSPKTEKLTDLLLPLEDVQPPILCRFPRLGRFIILQHDAFCGLLAVLLVRDGDRVRLGR